MEDVVIVGAGLGGVMTAYELRRQLGAAHRIRVASNGTRFSFIPSAPWVAAGWRRRSDVTIDLQEPFGRCGITLLAQGARRIDPVGRRVEMNDGACTDYACLVIATGFEPAFDVIEGLGLGGGRIHSICRMDDAVETKAAIDALIADPGPVVIGAAQGSSCLGPTYEFALVLDRTLRKARVRDRARITFVTPEPFLGHFGLGGVGAAGHLLEIEFQNRDIASICNARIDKIGDGRIAISRMKDATIVETAVELPFAFSMIMPPFRGVSAVQGIDGLTDSRGMVLVDEFMRSRAFPDVFAVGSCIAIPSAVTTPLPVGIQATGFMIQSMAMAAVRNIRRLIVDEDVPDAVANRNMVFLTDFGERGVAVVAQPEAQAGSAGGGWVHPAKVAFEKYFLHKVRSGQPDGSVERLALQMLGIDEMAAVKLVGTP